MNIHDYGRTKIMWGWLFGGFWLFGCFFCFFPWECGSLITMALGRARILYLEQPLAIFLCYILKRAFPVLCHSFSKTQQLRGCRSALFRQKSSIRWRELNDLCFWAYAGRCFSISVSSNSVLLIFMDVAVAYVCHSLKS